MGRKMPDEIAHLQRRTREVLAGGPRTHDTKPGRDWIGNRWESGASKINVMLIDGATLEQWAEARGAVREHLYCLEHDLGLPVVCRDGVYMFDRGVLGAAGIPATVSTRQPESAEKPVVSAQPSPSRSLVSVAGELKRSSPSAEARGGHTQQATTSSPTPAPVAVQATEVVQAHRIEVTLISPADRSGRLGRTKLLLEVAGVAVTVLGGILALVWRFK